MGVVELRPQIAIEPKEPLEAKNPMSSPFSVQNTGYFGFWVDDARCVVRKVTIGNSSIKNGMWDSIAYHNHYLDRANSTTIFCKIANANMIPSEADIQVVVEYRPWRSFPMSFGKVFRFVGRYGDRWEWTAEEPDLSN